MNREHIARVGLLLALCLGTVVLLNPTLKHSPSLYEGYSLGTVAYTTNQPEVQYSEIVFVGDVMLAREVALIQRVYGAEYPFQGHDLRGEARTVVGNFEGAIAHPEDLTITKPLQFIFSSTTPDLLAKQGFTHMSLANNHSLDAGAQFFASTSAAIAAAGITPFGHPTAVSESSVTYVESPTQQTVALIGLHTLFESPSFEALDDLFLSVNQQSDIQIVYVQWGEEYELNHSPAQEQLADTLVQLGADLIVGHHPHVTQGIGEIRGVPVFYSIGNYIFDQYFSTDVQQGLVLETKFESGTLQIELEPISTIGSVMQPRSMSGRERERFLNAVAERSAESLRSNIRAGILEIDLASSQ